MHLTIREWQATLSLGAIQTLRLLGLFLILPVFALYAHSLPDTTPWLIGLALGGYGLTQALLQIPFGWLSDRLGRRPILIFGLLLFALGSGVAAYAETIYGVILGRILQGSGAVSAVGMALAADLIREELRPRTMAILGISIGVAFMIALLVGPPLAAHIGVQGLFWFITGLAGIAILIALFLVPKPPPHTLPMTALHTAFLMVLRDPDLLRLDAGMFTVHFLMTALFLAIPLDLQNLGLSNGQHWQVYLPVLCVSLFAMIPFIFLTEHRPWKRHIFLGAIVLLGLAQALLYTAGDTWWGLFIGLFGCFTGFNLMEAFLPALVAKYAPLSIRGAAMGVFSTAQFFGIFFGGILGGWMWQLNGVASIFLLGILLTLGWFMIASKLSKLT